MRGGGLALPAGDHQTAAHHNQDDAHERRDHPVVMGGDAYMRIAEADAVMFAMRDGNKKGKDPQDQHQNSDHHKSFHKMSPKIRIY